MQKNIVKINAVITSASYLVITVASTHLMGSLVVMRCQANFIFCQIPKAPIALESVTWKRKKKSGTEQQQKSKC